MREMVLAHIASEVQVQVSDRVIDQIACRNSLLPVIHAVLPRSLGARLGEPAQADRRNEIPAFVFSVRTPNGAARKSLCVACFLLIV